MRPGELERFALAWALKTAWVSEFWIPADPDFGYVDYFEAAATRNLRMLDDLQSLDLEDSEVRRELRRREAQNSEQATFAELEV